MLSEETKKKYVDGKGGHCPYCNSKDIEAYGSVDLDGNGCTQRVICLTCDKEWLDLYRLVDIIEDE